jgi:hypothetical protein
VWATAAAAMMIAAPLIYRATAPDPLPGVEAPARTTTTTSPPSGSGFAPRTVGSGTVDTARATPESLKYL